jgi:hypothetical protein
MSQHAHCLYISLTGMQTMQHILQKNRLLEYMPAASERWQTENSFYHMRKNTVRQGDMLQACRSL